jgi:outer membrane immunogenic protein
MWRSGNAVAAEQAAVTAIEIRDVCAASQRLQFAVQFVNTTVDDLWIPRQRMAKTYWALLSNSFVHTLLAFGELSCGRITVLPSFVATTPESHQVYLVSAHVGEKCSVARGVVGMLHGSVGKYVVFGAMVGLVGSLSPSAFAQYYPNHPTTWTGFYIGAEGGYAHGRNDWEFTNLFGAETTSNGGLLGGQIGYMQQYGGLVFGVNGAWDWTRLSGTNFNRFDPTHNEAEETNVTSLATINGRLGVANGQWLAYGTAGVAFANLNLQDVGACGAGCTFFEEESAHRTGWDAGAGIAFAATNSIILGVEYNYIDLGGSDQTFSGNFHNALATEVVHMHPEINVVKANLTWKFDTGPRTPEPLK